MDELQWNDISKVSPKHTCDLLEELFLISDGKQINLAKWVNLLDEEPNGGHDFDEYDFKILGKFLQIKYWYGPINKPYFEQMEAL